MRGNNELSGLGSHYPFTIQGRGTGDGGTCYEVLDTRDGTVGLSFATAALAEASKEKAFNLYLSGRE